MATGTKAIACFPASPRIQVADHETDWSITPVVRRHSGNTVGPGEAAMFWFWWRHVSPLDEGIIQSASPFSDTFDLSYDIRATPERPENMRYNTFLRCSPQLSVEGEDKEAGKCMAPVPVSSEIFTEWTQYTEMIDKWVYRFAREGASQYEVSSGRALSVTASFSDTHAEQARLTRLLLWTSVFLGVLTEFFAAAVWSLAPTTSGGTAGTTIQSGWNSATSGVIISALALGLIVLFLSWLEYQRFTSNPILLHDLVRYVQTVVSRAGFGLSREDIFRCISSARMIWRVLVVLTTSVFVLMIWAFVTQRPTSDSWLFVMAVGIVLWIQIQFNHRRRT